MLSALTTFSACLRRQVVYLVCGCMLSMCVRAFLRIPFTVTTRARTVHVLLTNKSELLPFHDFCPLFLLNLCSVLLRLILFFNEYTSKLFLSIVELYSRSCQQTCFL